MNRIIKMDMKEKIITIPNLLSLYRLFVFPFIFWLIIKELEHFFAVFLCINLITDFLDGKIARRFNMVTRLGARLDSLADYGTLFLAFYGVIKFKAEDLINHGWLLYLFFSLMIVFQIISFIRFGSFTSFHLYSFKMSGYLLGALFFSWFFLDFYPWLYYLAVGCSILSEAETFAVIMTLKERRSDVKGLYWLIKEKNG